MSSRQGVARTSAPQSTRSYTSRMKKAPMKVFLTGTTGYLGSAIAKQLLANGHEVLGHVRTSEAADRVSSLGIVPRLGDVLDDVWLRGELTDVDGAVHAASPNDTGSAAFDGRILDTVLDVFAGTDQRYVHTGGSWIHGSGRRLNEASPYAPPVIVAWRPAVLDRIRVAASTVHATMVAPANLYGHGGGLVALLANAPTENGQLRYPGSAQAFPNVHVDDAAALFVHVLEHDAPGPYVIAANTESVPMDTLARALSDAQGLAGQIHGDSPEEARHRLGPLADPLLLNASIDSSAARALGGAPNGPTLIDEIRSGSYMPRSFPLEP
ncbi:NAD-dependent dehydratase [Curtobacterium sp. MCPF17_001]|nr:NAD-dependent dehydratase [Curtobacterium sp. MCPF17_001]